MARPPTDLRSLSRSFTEPAIRTLAGIAQHSENDGARVSACGMLLDRGWGKAPQSHTVEGDGEIRVIIRHITEGRDAPRPLDNSNRTSSSMRLCAMTRVSHDCVALRE